MASFIAHSERSIKQIIASLVILTVTAWTAFLPFPALSQEKICFYEVCFSPHGGCTDAIIRELDKAKTSVLVQAYSFTSAPNAKALLNLG